MFDTLRQPKKANKKMALNKGGSYRISQVCEMRDKVVISKMPLTVGVNLELIDTLLRYSSMSLCEKTWVGHEYLMDAFLSEEI